MKSLKLTKYFEIVNPSYCYFKLTPVKSLRNYNSEQIVTICTLIYKSLNDRIKKEDKKYWCTRSSKVLYYIYLEKSVVNFYFVLPCEHRNILLDKISNCWKNITITEISFDQLPQFSKTSVAYSIKYKYNDFMSINTNMTDNFLLSSICNTLNVMSEGDKCGVLVNINSVSRSKLNEWKAIYDNMVERYKDGYPIEKDYSSKFFFKLLCKAIYTLCDFAVECISNTMGFTRAPKHALPMVSKELSNSTKNKKFSSIVNTQIVVLSESVDSKRAVQNAVSLCQSFNVLNEDNEFQCSRVKCVPQITDTSFKGVDSMRMSTKESGKLLELASRELIEQYGIEHINTQEILVPEVLQTGLHCLGVNTCRGVSTPAYLPVPYNFAVMSICLVGQQGAGKTVFISNLVNSIQQQPESCVIIDYIKNCELCDSIIEQSRSDKVVILDFSDVDQLEAFSYNEIQPISDKLFDILDCINRKSLCVETLIDALNIDGEPLSVSMSMLLNAACNVTFAAGYSSLKEVIKCLVSFGFRHTCINKLPEEVLTALTDEVETLESLDTYDKNGVGETRTSKIEGVLSRISLLRKDSRLKYMFNKDDSTNLNFVEILEQNKTICIKLPQAIFNSPYVKNTIVCYLFTKIWNATLIRGALHNKPNMCTLCIDELFQCPTLVSFLSQQEILPQLRKFGLRCVFSCQHLEQLHKINDTLRSAGSSYMYLKGTSKKDFEFMEEELKPFTYEDLESLPQFHSLNLINTDVGRVPFITKLPKPL